MSYTVVKTLESANYVTMQPLFPYRDHMKDIIDHIRVPTTCTVPVKSKLPVASCFSRVSWDETLVSQDETLVLRDKKAEN